MKYQHFCLAIAIYAMLLSIASLQLTAAGDQETAETCERIIRFTGSS